MKYYRIVFRIILIFFLAAVMTLTICVAGLNVDDGGIASDGALQLAEGQAFEGSKEELQISSEAEKEPTESLTQGEGEEPLIAQSGAEPSEDPKEEALREAEEALRAFESEEEEKELKEDGSRMTLPRIVCFGDSLTESTGSSVSYPEMLGALSGAEVINYGIRSDTTLMIAARAGFVSIYTDELVIPAETSPVRLSIHIENGRTPPFLRYGDRGINPCYINGIKGRMSLKGGGYYFTRESPGDIILVEENTRVITGAMADEDPSDILVLFTGTNDSPDRNTISDIISLQRGILKRSGCDKFIVIGLTCKAVMPDIEKVNEALATEYGDNFLDIRRFMLDLGLEYEGLKATGGDREDIEKGEIPRSLRSDFVHGNNYFYDIIANLLYDKMQSLGYLPSGDYE